jgi:hypothetical protein
MSALQVVRGFFQVNFFTVTESIEQMGIIIAAGDTDLVLVEPRHDVNLAPLAVNAGALGAAHCRDSRLAATQDNP